MTDHRVPSASPAPAGLDVDVAVTAALRAGVDFFVPGEDKWISAIEFVKRWTAEYDALRAALASSPAPATTIPRLIETKLVVPAPAGLDDDALLDAIDSVYISSSDTGHLTTSEAMAIASAVRAASSSIRPTDPGVGGEGRTAIRFGSSLGER